MKYHVPVLLNESVNGLSIKPEGTYIDLTFGGGGHSKLILEKLNLNGKLFSFDTDDTAIKENSLANNNFHLITLNPTKLFLHYSLQAQQVSQKEYNILQAVIFYLQNSFNINFCFGFNFFCNTSRNNFQLFHSLRSC